MPIHKIEINEYECSWCSKKWISRINGKDAPIPLKCAHCKRANWNDPNNAMSGKENGLRRRIKNLNKVYYQFERDKGIFFPQELIEKFLSVSPRPSLAELYLVLYPLQVDLRKRPYWLPVYDENKKFTGKFVPDTSKYMTDKQGRKIWNYDNVYDKMLKLEADARIENMIVVLKSRGVEYDPYPHIDKMKNEYLEKKENERTNPKHIKMLKSLGDPNEIIELKRAENRLAHSNAAKKAWTVRHSQ